ncbi:MAG: zinc-binding dehydrogenase [Candidatus Bathyarchaeia archaeon]
MSKRYWAAKEMKVAVLTRDGFEIHSQKTPSCGPDQILVKTMACGICEGEVFYYRNRATLLQDEAVLGHEGSGLVAALGRNVEGFEEGDAVTALDGAFAEYFLASPESLVKLPEGLDPRWALGEPVACYVHAGNRFGIKLGDKVAVLGCGFMGLGCLQLARLQGAAFVCAIEPIPWRLDMARRLGADAVHSPETDNAERVVQRHGEFDVVIEATGVQSAIDMAGDLVKQHGRIILVGYHQSNEGMRTVNMKQWNYKAIDVVNGHVRRGDEKLRAMQVGIDLIRKGRLVIEPLVKQYPLPEVEKAFHDLIARKEGLFKAALTS